MNFSGYTGGEFAALMVIVFFFGLALGSFLNVVIYRLPRNESIVYPGSRCPACGSPIQYRDNIPVLSFMLLRGRCRVCSARISWRYPLTELFTGCMVAGLFGLDGLSVQFAADTILGVILFAAAAIDLTYMIIPNRLTYPGMLIAAGLSLRWGWYGLLRGATGALTGFLILSIMHLLGRLLFRRDSIGMGDVKLALVIGFFVGPLWSAVILVIAVTLGGMLGIVQLAAGKRARFREIPFGPYIAAGGFCVLFFKSQILFLVERYLDMW